MKITKKTLESENLIVSSDEDTVIIELKVKPAGSGAKKITIEQSHVKELINMLNETSLKGSLIPQPIQKQQQAQVQQSSTPVQQKNPLRDVDIEVDDDMLKSVQKNVGYMKPMNSGNAANTPAKTGEILPKSGEFDVMPTRK